MDFEEPAFREAPEIELDSMVLGFEESRKKHPRMIDMIKNRKRT
jgi:hypothetical protein